MHRMYDTWQHLEKLLLHVPPAFRMAVTATASVDPSMAPNSAASTGLSLPLPS
jgi:hypothetical protein